MLQILKKTCQNSCTICLQQKSSCLWYMYNVVHIYFTMLYSFYYFVDKTVHMSRSMVRSWLSIYWSYSKKCKNAERRFEQGEPNSDKKNCSSIKAFFNFYFGDSLWSTEIYFYYFKILYLHYSCFVVIRIRKTSFFIKKNVWSMRVHCMRLGVEQKILQGNI